MKLKTALLVMSALACGYVSAHPESSFDITYYSDAAHTTVVGGGWFTCSGQTHTYGTVTAYYDESNEEPCGEGGYGWGGI